MKQIAIIGATLTGNHGAEAMLTTTVGQLRDTYDDARFFVYSYYPRPDRDRITDASVTVHSSTPAYLVTVLFPGALLAKFLTWLHLHRLSAHLPKSVRDLASCDVLVDLAGVSFVQGREKFLPFNVLTIWPAMLLGVPVVKLSQAMGPFATALNRTCARWFLARCTRVFARGARTESHLTTLGLPEGRVGSAADVVFLHSSEYSLTDDGNAEASELLEALSAQTGVSTIGICPSSVVLRKSTASGLDYPGLLSTLARELVSQGHSVVLFPNATRGSSDGLRNNDLPVIEAILDRLDDHTRTSVLAVRGDMNAANIRRVIAACDTVVVSRFHAMIGALTCGVPVAVIGWSHKYVEVMQEFGLEEYVIDHNEADASTIQVIVGTLIEQRSQLADRINDELSAVRTSSRTQFDFLKRLLNESTAAI